MFDATEKLLLIPFETNSINSTSEIMSVHPKIEDEMSVPKLLRRK